MVLTKLGKWRNGGNWFSDPHPWTAFSMVHPSLQRRHNWRDGVSNHQPHDCLLNRLFRRRSMKPSKLRVTGFCAGNSPVTGELPAQMASNAENVSIWWRHHDDSSKHTTPWKLFVSQHLICMILTSLWTLHFREILPMKMTYVTRAYTYVT